MWTAILLACLWYSAPDQKEYEATVYDRTIVSNSVLVQWHGHNETGKQHWDTDGARLYLDGCQVRWEDMPRMPYRCTVLWDGHNGKMLEIRALTRKK